MGHGVMLTVQKLSSSPDTQTSSYVPANGKSAVLLFATYVVLPDYRSPEVLRRLQTGEPTFEVARAHFPSSQTTQNLDQYWQRIRTLPDPAMTHQFPLHEGFGAAPGAAVRLLSRGGARPVEVAAAAGPQYSRRACGPRRRAKNLMQGEPRQGTLMGHHWIWQSSNSLPILTQILSALRRWKMGSCDFERRFSCLKPT